MKSSTLIIGAIIGAAASHFFEAPVKAFARKVWGPLEATHPDFKARVAAKNAERETDKNRRMGDQE